MEVIANDDKQCNTGKHADSDKGYGISFVAERNSQEPAPPQDEPNSLRASLAGSVPAAWGNRFLSGSFVDLRTFACE